jgi:group I intron endonuclease
MIGIYKITNPNNRIYIGQSINIENRFLKYKSLDCKSQILLFKSLKKYGYENHIFEIIEECEINLLNEKERYWQDFYNAVSSENLNCMATKTNTKSGFLSTETKIKMSLSRTGKKRNPEFMERLKKINTGSKRSEESKEKMRLAQLGKKRTLESRIKQSNSSKGRVVSNETKKKMKLNNSQSKKILCLDTNILYISLAEYCEKNNLNYKTTWGKIKKNKLNLKQYGN